MPIIFDGNTLTITLASGVTAVDVVKDLYKAYKDYLLADANNRRFPQAFISDGGNSLTSIINQGSYIFLQNQVGWRIKPPEENITIFLTGNLAVADVTLPSVIPTTGAFTAALLGIQPVTQGVIPAMADQLAFGTFQGRVCIAQTNGNAGTGQVGSDLIGTTRAPVKDTDDSLTIAVREGIRQFNIAESLITTLNSDFSKGYHFVGESPFITFNAGAGLNIMNCSFQNLKLMGEFDGINKLSDCTIISATKVSGSIENCDLKGSLDIIGDTSLINSYSGLTGLAYPTIGTIAANTLIVRDHKGSLGLKDMTGGTHTVGLYGGRLVIEATCVGGTIHVRGDPYEIIDLSGGAVTLIDQTSSQKLTEIWQHAGLDKTRARVTHEDGSVEVGTVIDINAATVGATPNRTTTQTRQ